MIMDFRQHLHTHHMYKKKSKYMIQPTVQHNLKISVGKTHIQTLPPTIKHFPQDIQLRHGSATENL